MSDNLHRFIALFQGSPFSHGLASQNQAGKWNHVTEAGPATEEDFQRHLSGEKSLGIVPAKEDGTCTFGAIDIDVDTVHHLKLHNHVKQRKMPLIVCRSKSGGAHLYVFMQLPGQKTSKVVLALRRWAGILAYPSSEIFPKQASTDKQNRGNFINLPYFSGDRSTRYAVGDEGALSLQGFLDSIIYWDGEDNVIGVDELKVLNDNAEMPPCLKKLTELGVQEGQRNSALFGFAVYFRKSTPTGWEDKVRAHNLSFFKPPLSQSECNSVIRSASRAHYQYSCNTSPLIDHCQRKECLTLKFGVSYMPWADDSQFDKLVVSHLRKILTDPPQFILEVNGHDVALTSEQFFSYQNLRTRVEQILDMVLPAKMSEEKWSQVRKTLHLSQEEIAAPEDASLEGQILSDVMDFLANFKKSKNAEDLLKGQPVLNGSGHVLFKVLDLQKFLRLHRRTFVESDVLFRVLQQQGAQFKVVKVKGKNLRVWMYPISKLNWQDEGFTPETFNTIGDDL